MSQSDMFLRVEGSKQGLIKGESSDTAHLGEIDLVAWSWGMDGSAGAFAQATARTTLQELIVFKRVDSATTALMSALRNNEVIKKAVLVVRKAGGAAPVEYFRMTMEKARITAHRVHSMEGSPELREELRLAFWKVQVEYRPQDAGGGGRATHTFDAEVTPQ
ncbi:Hcp family type VI secretion system effector [Leptothrix ochracea]|uniref:Hcp family type VI secretion system effector n=1 Tax=Leptothrix ochracea TaxID=735331 RepID=UPI0034E2BDA2